MKSVHPDQETEIPQEPTRTPWSRSLPWEPWVVLCVPQAVPHCRYFLFGAKNTIVYFSLCTANLQGVIRSL